MKIVFNNKRFYGTFSQYSDSSGLERAWFVQDRDWIYGDFGVDAKPYALVSSGSQNKVEQFSLKELEVRFSHRTNFGAVVFKDKIFVVSGNSDLSDVWSSFNGKVWTQETANAGFGKRSESQIIVFKNKIFLITGKDENSDMRRDIWSSSDGKVWEQETAIAEFGFRKRMSVVVFKNKLWLIGGIDNRGNDFNDVWSSSDGKVWAQDTADAGFSKRSNFASVVFKDKIFVMGGSDVVRKNLNDVWSSSDGKAWAQDTADAGFSKRSDFASAVFKNKIFVIDGFRDDDSALSDVWGSFDGKTWTQELAFTSSDDTEDLLVKEIVLGEEFETPTSVNASKSVKLPQPRFAMDGAQIKDATAIALRSYTMQSVPMSESGISLLLRLYRENKNKPVLVIWEADEYGDEPMLAILKLGAATRKAFIYQVKITLTEVL